MDNYLKHYNYKIRSFEEVYNLSLILAHHFPEPDHFFTAIYELIFNAVEHGNLEIGFENKTKLLRQGLWEQEVLRRFSMPEYREKEVAVKLNANDNEFYLTIADQGKGFPWKEFLGRKVDRTLPNGRGLWIASSAKFDQITFNTEGNEVTCMMRQ